jgi:hypothetical protein
MENVALFKYKGIMLQKSSTKCRIGGAVTQASQDIQHLTMLSNSTAIALFNFKIFPASTYGIQLI